MLNSHVPLGGGGAGKGLPSLFCTMCSTHIHTLSSVFNVTIESKEDIVYYFVWSILKIECCKCVLWRKV